MKSASSFPPTLRDSAVRIDGPGGVASGVLVHHRDLAGSSHFSVLTAGRVVHMLLAKADQDVSQLRMVMPAISGVKGRAADIPLSCLNARSAYSISQQLKAHNKNFLYVKPSTTSPRSCLDRCPRSWRTPRWRWATTSSALATLA